jgi:hypothetical protein
MLNLMTLPEGVKQQTALQHFYKNITPSGNVIKLRNLGTYKQKPE